MKGQVKVLQLGLGYLKGGGGPHRVAIATCLIKAWAWALSFNYCWIELTLNGCGLAEGSRSIYSKSQPDIWTI